MYQPDNAMFAAAAAAAVAADAAQKICSGAMK